MKKIVVLVVSLLLFPKIFLAEENHFYLDSPIEGIYTMMDKVDRVAANYVKPVRKVGTNEYVYCVTPGIAINPDGNYNKIENNQWDMLNITKSKYEKLQVISYYGYLYNNHTDLKWYAVTQYLIWQEVMPEGWDVYFTNTLRGPKSNDFDWMINEINQLVSNYYTNPSFSLNIEGNYKNDTILYDSYNVLNNYNSNNSKAVINGNSITLKPSNESYSFQIDYKTDNKQSNLYTYNNAQWVISRGSLPNKTINYNVNIFKGGLKITKQIGNKDELSYDYNPSLANAKYRIFNSNYSEDFITDINGIINISNLNIDNYYLKEIEAPNGFEIDNTLYKISINKNKVTKITLYDDLIISSVNINKKYLNIEDNTYIPEKDAIFEILDSNNITISRNTTDNLGNLTFNLPIGIYKLTQLKGIDNYDLIKDEEIEIIDSAPIYLNYLNNPIAKDITEDTIESFSNPEITSNDLDNKILDSDLSTQSPITNLDRENQIKPEFIKKDDYIKSKQITESILPIDNSPLFTEKIQANNHVINPQTSDNIKSNLLILMSSIIIITTFIVKKLMKKKEIETK